MNRKNRSALIGVRCTGLFAVAILVGAVSATTCWGIETFRVYDMGESDPGAVIGGTNTVIFDSLSNPDDIGGALVP
ncbi:MAG: hypothetical protein ACR2NU_09940, partial [Aeoliella sp.]